MKVLIKTNNYYTTLAELRASNGNALEMHHPAYCEECGSVLTFFKGSAIGDDDLKLDDNSGYWVKHKMKKLENMIEFVDVDIIPNDYIDLTSLHYLDSIRGKNYDYHFIRRNIIDYVASVGFDNLSESEKLIASKYCAADASTLVPYFMVTYGLDYETAISKYKVYRSIDIFNAKKALSERSMDPAMMYIAVKYMDEQNASIFSDNIRNYISDLRETAHLGLNYGQARDGIMDYIEATNGYVGGGLSTFSFENGYTFEECRDEFKNFLIYGTKPEEFDVLSS